MHCTIKSITQIRPQKLQSHQPPIYTHIFNHNAEVWMQTKQESDTFCYAETQYNTRHQKFEEWAFIRLKKPGLMQT